MSDSSRRPDVLGIGSLAVRFGVIVAVATLTTSTSLSATATAVESEAPTVDGSVRELVVGWNEAGFNLLRQLPPDEGKVVSPASIAHALLMISAAGDEATAAAIDEALGSPTDAHAAWSQLAGLLVPVDPDRVTLAMANRIWPRGDVTPDPDWIELLARDHDVDLELLDYHNDPDGSREIVNDWVSDRTEGLIPTLLPEGSIDADTVLVLTNAVFFEADWARRFVKYEPVAGVFTDFEGNESDVEFMRELELADRRGEGDGFVGAEIAYAGGDYSMLVLVPDAGTFTDFVDRLDQRVLDEIDSTFTTGPYELLLPRWEQRYQIDLDDWLTGVGAAPGRYPAISPGAFLDVAVHEATISVDEYGTVAAAATGLAIAHSGPPEPELTIAADRPFVYLIRHEPTGLILFTGHVTELD